MVSGESSNENQLAREALNGYYEVERTFATREVNENSNDNNP